MRGFGIHILQRSSKPGNWQKIFRSSILNMNWSSKTLFSRSRASISSNQTLFIWFQLAFHSQAWIDRSKFNLIRSNLGASGRNYANNILSFDLPLELVSYEF